jgi:cation:H+ antiporter
VLIAAFLTVMVAGLVVTALASQRTFESARDLAERLELSPFIIGVTVVALGTDLPEIANSIAASATGHGDVNVGDSVGSSLTQITLILGLLCLVGRVTSDRKFVAVAGSFTVASVLLGSLLLLDGEMTRLDGLVLVSAWVVGMVLVQRLGHIVTVEQRVLFHSGTLAVLRRLAGGLLVVGGSALLAVWAFTEVAARLGVPEYATSFLALSLGTSLPELAVDGRALRAGESSLALGGLIGASLADATLSLGIGPLLFPTTVSSSAAGGSLIAAAVMGVAVVWLWSRSEHHRGSGVVLILAYACAYLVILS